MEKAEAFAGYSTTKVIMLEEPYNTRLTLSNGTKQKYVFLDDHNQMVGSQDADYTFSNIIEIRIAPLYWWYLCKLFSRAGDLLDDLFITVRALYDIQRKSPKEGQVGE